MKFKNIIASLLVGTFLFFPSVYVDATGKSNEKIPSIYAEENAKISVDDSSEFYTPEYIEAAKKSALKRQEMYKNTPLTKEIQLDKGANARSYGTYPRRKGVILVTDSFSGTSIPLAGHSGIIWSGALTEESFAKALSPKKIDGVWFYDNDWDKRYDRSKVMGLSVKGTSVYMDEAVANWAEKQEGKPYNINFWDWKTRSKFYCSQLVYAGFLDVAGIDIWGYNDIVYPADLAHSNKTELIYQN